MVTNRSFNAEDDELVIECSSVSDRHRHTCGRNATTLWYPRGVESCHELVRGQRRLSFNTSHPSSSPGKEDIKSQETFRSRPQCCFKQGGNNEQRLDDVMRPHLTNYLGQRLGR